MFIVIKNRGVYLFFWFFVPIRDFAHTGFFSPIRTAHSGLLPMQVFSPIRTAHTGLLPIRDFSPIRTAHTGLLPIRDFSSIRTAHTGLLPIRDFSSIRTSYIFGRSLGFVLVVEMQAASRRRDASCFSS